MTSVPPGVSGAGRLVVDVVLVHDDSLDPQSIVGNLRNYLDCHPIDLDRSSECDVPEAGIFVFGADLQVSSSFRRVRKIIEQTEGRKIFVLPAYNRSSISRIYDLNISDYLVQPVDVDALHAMLKVALNDRTENLWETLHPAKREALQGSLACFKNCFSLVQRGEPLPIEEIHSSCDRLRRAAALGGLDSWIEALDGHHNYSFRHSMFVAGTMVYFAHAIGIGGAELEKISVGGLLHDIGKSQVPHRILDKAGRLDDGEWATMRRHPEYSREIFLANRDVDADVVAMAVHHHEKLDGNGYPDGLSSSQISDFVRITSIADVYSALIDKRSYKNAMGQEEALEIMAGFEGHLDMDLLAAFGGFVRGEV